MRESEVGGFNALALSRMLEDGFFYHPHAQLHLHLQLSHCFLLLFSKISALKVTILANI